MLRKLHKYIDGPRSYQSHIPVIQPVFKNIYDEATPGYIPGQIIRPRFARRITVQYWEELKPGGIIPANVFKVGVTVKIVHNSGGRTFLIHQI